MSTSCPGTLALGSEGPRGRRAAPGDSGSAPSACGVAQLSLGNSGPFPRACGVHQLSRVTRTVPEGPGVEELSWATRACVSGDPRSTSYPRRLGLEPDVPWGRAAIPGDSGPVRRDRAVDQLSRTPRAQARGSSVSTSCAVRHGPGSEGPWVDQLPLANCTVVRVPAGTTSCPGGLGPGGEGPACRPAIPCESGPGLRPRGLDQLSLATYT